MVSELCHFGLSRLGEYTPRGTWVRSSEGVDIYISIYKKSYSGQEPTDRAY
jgi:hypothetical protein